MRRLDRGSPGYPPELESLPDPPRAIWVRGEIPGGPRVAVVGARGASAGGRRFAFELAAQLARAGVAVVSGGARGIDRAAHDGALSAGVTVAVLGSGADVPYPREHAALFDAVARRGAVLSEAPPGSPPRRGSFPRRNRLIAALAGACVVVQADERSGSMSTARFARAVGRPVLAVPWAPDDPLGRGTAELLRQGARVATGALDVLHALGMTADPSPTSVTGARCRPSGLAGRILAALGSSGASIDEIVRATTAPLPEVSAALLTLEVDGWVVRSDCGRVERAPHG